MKLYWVLLINIYCKKKKKIDFYDVPSNALTVRVLSCMMPLFTCTLLLHARLLCDALFTCTYLLACLMYDALLMCSHLLHARPYVWCLIYLYSPIACKSRSFAMPYLPAFTYLQAWVMFDVWFPFYCNHVLYASPDQICCPIYLYCPILSMSRSCNMLSLPVLSYFLQVRIMYDASLCVHSYFMYW